MKVFVCTVVHHPLDARILHRQIRALLEAGHQVTYAAPFSTFDAGPGLGIRPIDLPRAVGRRRWRALAAARRALREHGSEADLVILHDPELLLALPGLRLGGVIVWDVHEDTGSALVAKPWLPALLRPVVRAGIRFAESLAERRLRLILAEGGYRVRFRREHPVIPNHTYVPEVVPPPAADRVVYLGHLSAARGVDVMVRAARIVSEHGIRMELLGSADSYSRRILAEAEAEGVLRWHGFVPNDKALAHLGGALCGISLLRDLPNYRHSTPTKIVEYMAYGIPVVTTALPRAVELVEENRCGLVVPYDDPRAAADAILRLCRDEDERREMGRNGHAAALAHHHWPANVPTFLKNLESWADGSRR